MERGFTYIDDIVDGILAAVDKNYSHEIFNLGNSKTEKLMDLIKIIEMTNIIVITPMLNMKKNKLIIIKPKYIIANRTQSK